MIEFTFVRWKNFISYGDSWTEVPLNGNKATLVVGDNGAGKSTVIDALCYSLYGKAFRDVATTQLVNSVNTCLLYTSPSPRDGLLSRMPSSA